MKGDGGIIGLTGDSDAMLRWALAGPEQIRAIEEFEDTLLDRDNRDVSRIDVVFDQYFTNSLKAHTIESRKSLVIRQRVSARGKVPSNCQQF